MQGHIRKRSKDSWTVVVALGRDPVTGKRQQLWRSLKGTKREAEALLAQLIHERDTGIDQPVGRLTLADYLIKWLSDYARPSTAPRTYERYSGIVRNHLTPALGSIQLTKLRPQHIQSYYGRALTEARQEGQPPLAARTVLHHHRVLREALAQAVRWQLLARNPADGVEPPKVERRENPTPSPENIDKLLGVAASTPYEALIHLAVMTGLRQGELLGLRWTDINLDSGVLSVSQSAQYVNGVGMTFRPPKTPRSRRPVVLSPVVIDSLRSHRQVQVEGRLELGPVFQDHGLVFCQQDGRPIDPSNFRRSWRKIVEEAKVGHVRFHDLRHAHATQLLMAGVHPKIVSERLGHSTISITMDTYSHVLPGLQEEAVEKLDQWLAGRRVQG